MVAEAPRGIVSTCPAMVICKMLKELVVAARTDQAMAERMVETIRHDLRSFMQARMPNFGVYIDDVHYVSLGVIYKRFMECDVDELGRRGGHRSLVSCRRREVGEGAPARPPPHD